MKHNGSKTGVIIHFVLICAFLLIAGCASPETPTPQANTVEPVPPATAVPSTPAPTPLVTAVQATPVPEPTNDLVACAGGYACANGHSDSLNRRRHPQQRLLRRLNRRRRLHRRPRRRQCLYQVRRPNPRQPPLHNRLQRQPRQARLRTCRTVPGWSATTRHRQHNSCKCLGLPMALTMLRGRPLNI